jgi:hypothetical protein
VHLCSSGVLAPNDCSVAWLSSITFQAKSSMPHQGGQSPYGLPRDTGG